MGKKDWRVPGYSHTKSQMCKGFAGKGEDLTQRRQGRKGERESRCSSPVRGNVITCERDGIRSRGILPRSARSELL